MKKQLLSFRRSLSLVLPALVLAIAAPVSRAADVFGPPATVDYQGMLKGPDGNPLGNTAPTNYEVQFRLYDAQTGGTVIWAEKQIVTVSGGLFSVRLGEGDEILGAGSVPEGAVGHASPGLPGAFNGRERFLGVTVTIPGQTPSEITPRLAFLASPFSYVAGRAQSADRLVQTGSSQPSSLNVGSVSYVPLVLTSSSTLSGSNTNILADAAAAAVTATLPSGVAGAAGEKKEFTFTKTDSSANAVTVSPPAGGTINGGGAVSLPFQGDSVTIRNTDGNSWWISSRYNVRAVNTDAAGKVALTIAAAPITSGTTSVENSLAMLVQNSDTSAVGGTHNGAGIGFGRPGATRQAIVGGGWAQDYLDFYTTGDLTNRKMRISQNGATVYGDINATGLISGQNVTSNFYNFAGVGDSDTGMQRAADGMVRLVTNGAERLRADGGGIIVYGGATVTDTMAIGGGVGADQRARLVVYGSVWRDNGAFAYYSKDGNGVLFGSSGGAVFTGIYSDYRMVAPEFNALSDARIKTIKGVSNGSADLKTLMGMEVTDYVYRDSVAKGSVPQKKLIAQQVEKVFPQAIAKSTDVIPDIMKKATLEDGWVILSTDLKKGEKVRLLGDKGTDKVFEVLEVKDDRFRTTLETTEKEVFVYGRQVDDFRTVDYDAIAMLNVSATQQVKKDSDSAEEALRKENKELRERIAALEAANKAREDRLAVIEAALLGKNGKKIVTVSTK